MVKIWKLQILQHFVLGYIRKMSFQSLSCLPHKDTRMGLKFNLRFISCRRRSSSVSFVSDYGLDDQGSIPDRGRGFFL
jgi:hypothetical protein